MTKQLTWFFGPSGSEEHGPQDSITRTFTGNKYYSLAREVIQNSLDAVQDKTKPVRVAFSIFELGNDQLPGIFDLAAVIKQCRENYNDAQKFVKFCDKALGLLATEEVKCLRIADYNTKGLEHGDGKTPFYAFMQAVGYTKKENKGAGGSFGFGKGAYYAASAFRTIMVSSVYGDGEFIFQGKSRLTTHYDESGQKKDYTGLLGLERSDPVTSSHSVPNELVRIEKGTDVIIVGFDDDEHTWKDSLIKSVLNNFWLAIWDEKLVVEVEGTLITKDNLEATIENYYSETNPDGSVSEPETWNPYPYFKAVKYAGGPNNHVFEKELPTLGKVKLYVLLKENLPNRTVFMRGPKMTVYKKTSNRGSTYVAVFVCEDPDGDVILREMENPEHNEWKKNNYLGNDDKPHPDAIRAESELRNFITNCLDTLIKENAGSKQKILGLEEFLTIPEDLIADEEGDGESASGAGQANNEITDDETGSEVVVKPQDQRKLTLKSRKRTTITETGKGNPDGTDPTFTGGTGGDGQGGGNGQPGGNPGTHETGGTSDGTEAVKKPLSIRYRVVAQRSLGDIVHFVKLFSEKEATADVEFFAGVDNDTSGDQSLVIKAAVRNGQIFDVSQNKIRNLQLSKGENDVMVIFDSGQKHTLQIKSYEI